jgi:hypothetical protein
MCQIELAAVQEKLHALGVNSRNTGSFDSFGVRLTPLKMTELSK